jgi:transglutaminase-like putative cysteine protease
MSFPRPLALLAALFVAGPAHAVEPHDQWYAIVMQDRVTGWMHDVWTHEDGKWTAYQETNIEIARGATVIKTLTRSTSVETDDGALLSMDVSAVSSGAQSTIRVTVTDGVATVVTRAGDREQTSTKTIPAGCVGPVALRAQTLEHIATGEREFATCGANVMSTSGGSSMRFVVDAAAATSDALGDVTATPTVWTSDMIPGVPTREWLLPDGLMFRTEVSVGAIQMVMRRNDGPVTLDPPLELMVQTFVPSATAIAKPRNKLAGRYRLAMKEGALPSLPTAGAQRVQIDGDGAVVDVDLRRQEAATDAEDPRWRASTLLLETGDPKLVELASDALEGVKSTEPAAKAEALRRFVFRYITHKDLSVGFGSASEVARGRRGDCTEHAVLLAGLLRVAGVPSRVASGLVYSDSFMGRDQVFVFHMWTQALLPVRGVPTWIDLDAALSDKVPSDATHIALSLSGLEDGAVLSTFTTVVQVLGQLTVDVLDPPR